MCSRKVSTICTTNFCPRGVARALVGALSGMRHVVDGIDAVAKLQDPHTGPAAIQRMLDDAGVDDAYERDVHAEMLRQALADLNQASRSSP